ncbi:hypothetical protein B0I35DRAFT_477331 [Stachybotrys elegans]|uniref:Hsp70 family protein n=1 Tax=Stachybotrys elegans TaxID=80388 RepID=A0A8K0WT44_9HYPO|nr:hypothetical protein B0I35DRAFT_477331 [Stachybotrys elegans]
MDCESCESPTFVMALDMGATFSGAYLVEMRYCPDHDLHRVYGERRLDKFRTAMSYDAGNGTVTFMGPEDTAPIDRQLQYFKVALTGREDWQGSQEAPAEHEWVARHLQDLGVALAPATVVSEYFRGFFAHAWVALEMAREMSKPGAKLQVVVTHPACWSGGTQERFRRAVQDASIHDSIHWEDEAIAALRGVVYEMRGRWDHYAQGGDSIMVLDCGGLTADAGLFRFKGNMYDLAHGSSSVSSRSQLLGSLGIDQRFRDVFQRLTRSALSPESREVLARDIANDERLAMERWTTMLRRPGQNQIQSGMSVRIAGRTHHITRSEIMTQVFSDYISGLVSLVSCLYEHEVSHRGVAPKVLLVTGGITMGGLVLGLIREQVRHKYPGLEISLPQLQFRWNIVAYGAAHYLVNGTMPME